jgi:hypothetical protein
LGLRGMVCEPTLIDINPKQTLIDINPEQTLIDINPEKGPLTIPYLTQTNAPTKKLLRLLNK